MGGDFGNCPTPPASTRSFQELCALQHPTSKLFVWAMSCVPPNRVTRLISHHIRLPVVVGEPVSIRALRQTFRVFRTTEMKSEGVERANPPPCGSRQPGDRLERQLSPLRLRDFLLWPVSRINKTLPSPSASWPCRWVTWVFSKSGECGRDPESTQLLEPSPRYCGTRSFEMNRQPCREEDMVVCRRCLGLLTPP